MLTIQDYYADWCGPCKVVRPVLAELEREYAGKVVVEQIDVDANQEKAAAAGIQSIPTLVFVKDGKEVDRMVGAQSKNSLVRLVGKYIV